MQKDFKTIDQQIEILKNKGLIIDDYDKVNDILLKENYFFINGYRFLFMNSNDDRNFIRGTTFKELYSLFLFDRYVRNILFKNLLIFENNFKSVISYQLSKKYGYREKDYLNPKNFVSDPSKKRRVKDIIEKMRRQIRINVSRHSATLHYSRSYGYIPLWILVKVLSFGLMCELYSILKQQDKDEIAAIFGVPTNYLDDFLPLLSNYRNLCAHEDIVFDHKTEKYISDNEYHEKLKIFRMDDEYVYGKNDIFAVVIIFKYLLSDDNFRLLMKEMEYEIEALDGRVDVIPIGKILDHMGFPKNYMDIVNL